MNLGFGEAQKPYVSESQNARTLTEGWVHAEAYCPSCGASNIEKYENNRPVADFYCSSCCEDFELKSKKTVFGAKIPDGAFRTMCERLASENNPNLMLLQYSPRLNGVTDLLIVPKHFFVREMIEKRPPLATTARRAGWVGCNILLGQVPESGKIFLVRNGQLIPKELVLDKWRETLFLRDQSVDSRGWLVEVMKCVELVGRRDFSLDDIYAFEPRLHRIFPNNNNVRPKIRQQLQVLRDQGFLEFVSRGSYRLRMRGNVF